MSDDRYLPRAPSLRPAPKRRPNILPEPPMTYEEVRNKFVPALEPADLPAQPVRGPWEPKED